MSSGHVHATKLDPVEAKALVAKALGSSAFRVRVYDSKYIVNRDFDIPYLGGYSNNARTIYVDRHFPTSLLMGGVRVAAIPFITLHERVEKALLDIFDYKYTKAHQVATFMEHKDVVSRLRVTPAMYERSLDPFIKADQHEKILKVPKDLDLEPYRDSRDLKLLERMKDKMV